MQSKQTLQVAVLTLIGLGLLAVIFYTPIWWVSLTAPNYPEESFPDGVRIHFHMNGVFNGCEKQEKAEIVEDEALDCVHEMDTINHYVGMYPIAAGGPVERGFGQFLMAFLGVMLIGFIFTGPKQRMIVLTVGFTGIAAWMAMTLYGENGFNLQNKGYVSAMVTSLDQEASGETGEPEIVIGGVTGVLKDSLEASGVEVILPSELEAARQAGTKSAGAEKAHLIEQLKLTYDIDQVKSDSLSPWDGSSFQVMTWHYAKSLGRYFNNPQEIVPMVKNLELAIHLVFYAILGAMALVVFGSRRNGGMLYWLLILVPIALPVFFVIDYSAWLWWYGHTLNDMGAFSVKPFMPTVFGDGKVAQFTTHSYPYIGFGLMLLTSLILAVAALLRFKQLKQ
ncbi:MAG: hypothetical protein KUF77_13535 [Candidatus Thiodiazotropha sp. (ex Lucina aurantia)]|uniref:Cytochrome C n=1 Tax=Candidatus Thiodiazotropha endolucinida TaxID=1655433 RepID=A0A7Z0VHZ6_9GAMM|nr:hypothetical protein [Candidatus Thiodiazotropha endolucinida]MBT3012268.1 hypothetical protein [Candidatus Thiodiazotropha sp. (ex Lucina pensylvanica)]MBT3024415.1 hypothetical protein [Candidatus Thiodiazotropha taylori]MBV2099283.1 hypothetical protein [Candidatus Thiodiazotropha sp. (ex Codakia orbicularis)]MBV2104041.1 hypothetical protein [Candidatus Thiodiazotropha sp. (ex Lucina aurantia)]MBV2118532.1 hypothetical protein [Candidatus Thiodiazotropha sp. (ex Lucina aurantia)]